MCYNFIETNIMKKIKVTLQEEGQTIYKFIRKHLNKAPLSFIEKLFRLKDVKVNKKRVNKSFVISKDDIIEIYLNEKQYDEFTSLRDEVKLKQVPNIIYEDGNILIVNKPSGLLVHGDKNEKRITLTNIVLSYLSEKGEYSFNSNMFTPSLAHRIDRNTSGLVVFGKNIKALQALEDIFKDHSLINKHYYALVKGRLKEEGIIDKALLKDEAKSIVKIVDENKGGKKAITKYKVKETFSFCSLVDVCLLTGRTHQIRVHFASINHPLLGDNKYGDFALNKEFFKKFKYQNQFLHAYKLEFKQINGFLSYLSNKIFISSLGDKEKLILSKLRNGDR